MYTLRIDSQEEMMALKMAVAGMAMEDASRGRGDVEFTETTATLLGKINKLKPQRDWQLYELTDHNEKIEIDAVSISYVFSDDRAYDLALYLTRQGLLVCQMGSKTTNPTRTNFSVANADNLSELEQRLPAGELTDRLIKDAREKLSG